MFLNARSEKPLPVILTSSPPVVQPVVDESVTWRGLVLEYKLESSNSGGELSIGENATVSKAIDTNKVRISVG